MNALTEVINEAQDLTEDEIRRAVIMENIICDSLDAIDPKSDLYHDLLRKMGAIHFSLKRYSNGTPSDWNIEAIKKANAEIQEIWLKYADLI